MFSQTSKGTRCADELNYGLRMELLLDVQIPNPMDSFAGLPVSCRIGQAVDALPPGHGRLDGAEPHLRHRNRFKFDWPKDGLAVE